MFMNHAAYCFPVPYRRTADADASLEKLAAGKGSMKDIEELEYLAKGMYGRTFCPMGTGMVEPVLSALRLFRPEFERKRLKTEADSIHKKRR